MMVVGRPQRPRLRLRVPSSAELSGLEDDLIPTLADIEQGTQDLDAKIRAFGTDTFAHLEDVTDTAAYLVAWNQFVADFDAWRDKFWIDRWGRRNEVISLRARFNGLQQFWARISAPAAVPAPSTPAYTAAQTKPPSLSIPNLLGAGLGIPSWLIPALLGVGGLVFVAPYLAPSIAKTLGSLKGAKHA